MNRSLRALRGRTAAVVATTTLAVVAANVVAISIAGGASAAGTTTYSATQTLPVPPASNFAGSGGGDGWGLAFTPSSVFNVFHHNSVLTVACHKQTDASPCYDPVTVVDGSGHNFATSGQPGLYLDPATSKLYVFATRDDSTGGVVCFNTVVAAAAGNPFCGFTALSAIGDSPYSSVGSVGDPMAVGSKLFAFNFAGGSAVTGTKNKLLCFDTSTLAACASQPFTVAVGAGANSDNTFPVPAEASIGNLLIIPITMGQTAQISCFDPATSSSCSGSWPIAAPANYALSQSGAPFPLLTAAGAVAGFCLPDGTDECFSLTGASVATPAGMAATIGNGTGWNGPAAVIGPRVYVPIGGTDVVACYDANTSSSCSNFPKSFANLTYLYTVTRDPQRPTCLWVNADGGTAQIQNFDAFSGGACGSGSIRVLASSFVVPTVLCQPASYTSLQILDPARASYTSGTIAFQDASGNPIPGIPDASVDNTGSVDLSHLNLSTGSGLPQFVITLHGQTGSPGAVTVKLTWTGTDDPSCVPGGGPPPPPTLIMTGRAFSALGQVFLLGQSAVVISPTIQDTGPVSTTVSKTVAPQCASSPRGTTGDEAIVSGCARVTTDAAAGRSTASVSFLSLTIGIPNWPSLPTIALRGLSAASTTTCARSDGTMSIAYLKIGTKVLISTTTLIKPNTKLKLGVATIVLNEQIRSAAPGHGLVVNAVHVSVGTRALAGADVLIGSATTGLLGCP